MFDVFLVDHDQRRQVLAAVTNRGGGIYTGVYRRARDPCLLAAREAKVLAIDTPYLDVKDDDGCRLEAETAFRAGFDGKIALHPSQVPLIHAAFTPSAEQVDWARRVLDALAANGGGVAVVDGRMVDMPHKRNAQRAAHPGVHPRMNRHGACP